MAKKTLSELIKEEMMVWCNSDEALSWAYYIINKYMINYSRNININITSRETMANSLMNYDNPFWKESDEKTQYIINKAIDNMDIDDELKSVVRSVLDISNDFFSDDEEVNDRIEEAIYSFDNYLYVHEEIGLYLDLWKIVIENDTYNYQIYCWDCDDEEERYIDPFSGCEEIISKWITKRRERISDIEFNKQQNKLKSKYHHEDFRKEMDTWN